MFKQLKTLKESLIDNCQGETQKSRTTVIFWMSSFNHKKIDYYWDSNYEVRTPSSK